MMKPKLSNFSQIYVAFFLHFLHFFLKFRIRNSAYTIQPDIYDGFLTNQILRIMCCTLGVSDRFLEYYFQERNVLCDLFIKDNGAIKVN